MPRLLDGDPIEVDQSALTGESLPASRKSGDAVFSGSIARQGEIGALVYATGAHTYFGKTAELVQQAHTVSHFQRAVLKIGNYLIVLAVVLVALFRGDPGNDTACLGRQDEHLLGQLRRQRLGETGQKHLRIGILAGEPDCPMDGDDGLAGARRTSNARRPGEGALNQRPLGGVEENAPFLPRKAK